VRLRTRIASGVALLAIGAGAALLVWVGAEPPALRSAAPAAPVPVGGEAKLSLLAVGDTGKNYPFRPFAEGQRSVARGMILEDRRDPVDALVFLGDNFYPDGLQRAELIERVSENLVDPYCHFADLSGPRSAEVDDACPLPPDDRNPVPLLAVLGNHDYMSPESPGLEQREVPLFLPNWSVPEDAAQLVELEAGVSLVLVDSVAVELRGSADAVRDALRRARGPWRILAMHYPITRREDEPEAFGSYRSLIRRAIEQSGTPVQLVLSGHAHNLQIVTLAFSHPLLQVIAGGGSSRRPLGEPPFAGRRFGVPTTGFARIDLLGDDAQQVLVISLYTMPRYPIFFWAKPRLVSRWWVDRSGAAWRAGPAA
jgi:hypothetical protein